MTAQAPTKNEEASTNKAAPMMLKTKNGMDESLRRSISTLLNARLADTIDLMTQAKQAHWNVKGQAFESLHELFDEINAAVQGYADLVAERAVQLGAVVSGTARQAAERSGLKEYPLSIVSGDEHIEALSSALSAYGTLVRGDIETAQDKGDADTADILTEISRGTDKWLWLVESHRTPTGAR